MRDAGLATGVGLDVGHRSTEDNDHPTAAVLNVAEGIGDWAVVARAARDWLITRLLPRRLRTRVEIQIAGTGAVVKVSADDPDDAFRLLNEAVRSAGPVSMAWNGNTWQTSSGADESSVVSEPGRFDRARTVFVVHGRNKAAREGVFSFLRALGLHPIEWAEALAGTGHGAPYVGEVLDSIMFSGQAIIVLLTPDEVAYLLPEHADNELDPAVRPAAQARPNVMFEAGMALAKFPTQTVLVRMGDLRTFTDLDGRHVVRLDNSPQQRLMLAQRLKAIGCDVDMGGKDWLSAGDLTPPKGPDLSSAAAERPASPDAVSDGTARSGVQVLTDELELTRCVVVRATGGDFTVHGEATNTSTRQISAFLKATYYDANRVIIGTASGVVNQLNPNATKTFSLVTLDDVTGYADFSVQVDTVI